MTSYFASKAKAAIEGIQLAETNYDEAISALTARFGLAHLLFEDHIHSLLALYPVRSPADVEKRRDLCEQISFRVDTLNNLGVAATGYGVVLHRALMKALPRDLKISHRPRVKEASFSEEAVSLSGRVRQVNEILAFLHILVDVHDEGYFGHSRVL